MIYRARRLTLNTKKELVGLLDVFFVEECRHVALGADSYQVIYGEEGWVNCPVFYFAVLFLILPAINSSLTV